MATPPTRNPTLSARHADWLRSVTVRMAAPTDTDDLTPEAALARRVEYYRALWGGTAPEQRRADLPDGTCLVCGCGAIVVPGGFQCAVCVQAAEIVRGERS